MRRDVFSVIRLFKMRLVRVLFLFFRLDMYDDNLFLSLCLFCWKLYFKYEFVCRREVVYGLILFMF